MKTLKLNQNIVIMRGLLLFLLFLSVSAVTMAQSRSAKDIEEIMKRQRYLATPRNFTQREPIDELELKVKYNFYYTYDTTSKARYSEPMILEIGSQLNRYYSHNAYLRDSLQCVAYEEDIVKSGATAYRQIEYEIFPKNETVTYGDIFTYHSTSMRDVTLRVYNSEYQYSEEVGAIEWQIKEGSDTVLGYNCLIAEAEYRGRKWIVCFSLDIPYTWGPWKLGGLPGLILKCEDSEGLFKWEAISIESGKGRKIYKHSDRVKTNFSLPSYNLKKVKRSDSEKMWQRMWLAPHTIQMLFSGSNTREVGVKVGGRWEFVKVTVDMSIPDSYYPKLELDN